MYVQGDNAQTEALLQAINRTGKLHMVPASIKGKYIIRFTVTSTHTKVSYIIRFTVTSTHTKVANRFLYLYVNNDLGLTYLFCI